VTGICRSRAPAAELDRVEKSFAGVAALRGVDLSVAQGEVVALLGPNGAGKSTALRILLGLRRPDVGKALLFGLEPRAPAARAACGWTPQETSFPPTLTVRELVDLVRAHYRAPEATEALLGRFGLEQHARRQAGGLSGGTRRRLAIALAFAGRPQLAILDEPTTGLDVDVRRLVWDEIRSFATSGGTVLLTTHYLDEAEHLATRVVVLNSGRVVVSATPQSIRETTGLTRVRLKRNGARSWSDFGGVVRCDEEGEHVSLYARHGGELVERLVAAGVPLDGLEVAPATLEDAVRGLTQAP
jgi:ABC-2 type transport system ATP-binding protein